MPTLTETARGQKMNTQIKLDVEEVREFVGDFNEFFENLKEWTEDALQIRTWREHFLKKYPKIFGDSSENEVEMATTMETKPAIDREKKLTKVEEKLLSKRSKEKFTDYDGVMSDPDLTLAKKIIQFQKSNCRCNKKNDALGFFAGTIT